MKIAAHTRAVSGESCNGDAFFIAKWNGASSEHQIVASDPTDPETRQNSGEIEVSGGDNVLVAVIDGVGHGVEAAKVSLSLLDCLRENYTLDLNSLVRACHDAARRSRGATMCSCYASARPLGRDPHLPTGQNVKEWLAEASTSGKPEVTTNYSDHSLASKSAVAQEAPEPLQGSKIDRYVVLEVLGKGGMGVVYKAYDPQLNRGVALKLIRTRQEGRDSDGSARLLREAQALGQLNHPNVVSVHDVGAFGASVFVAMELVAGKTLKAWRKESKPTTIEVLEVMRAAGQGLAAAHKQGLIHRDFKPDNVIVGTAGRVRVIDFGLARAGDTPPSAAVVDQRDLEEIEATETRVLDKETSRADDTSEPPMSSSSRDLLSTPLTRVGSIVGTPLYMAPEQHLGAQVDARADQFSFCAVLYEVIYGRRPFSGGDSPRDCRSGPTRQSSTSTCRVRCRAMGTQRRDARPVRNARRALPVDGSAARGARRRP